MKRFATHLVLLAAVLCPVAASCAQIPAITADVAAEVACVYAQVEKGADVFEDIAAVCVPLAVTDVVTIVTALETQSADAGAPTALALKAKAVHHAAAK